MKSMSLTLKIVCLCLLTAILGAGVVYFGIHNTNTISKEYDHVAEINLPNAEALGGMLATQKDIFLKLVLWEQMEKPEQLKKEIYTLIEAYEKVDKWYQGIPFVEGEAELYDAVAASWKEFKEDTEAKLAGKSNGHIIEAHEKVGKAFNALVHFQSDQAKIWANHAKETAEKSFWLQMASLVALLVLSTLLSIIVGKGITKKVQVIVEHLSESANQVTSASSQIAGSSQTLSHAATQQAASLEETTAALEEISAMINKAAESAKTTDKSSAESHKKAEIGKASVDQMMVSMEDISNSNHAIMNQIDISNKQMAEIVRVIQEIGEKTKVINDIVFQTKLLSFNASVEAARAGEQGKGFSVVAEEVGNLAQMSGNAAKEITEMLEGSISKVQTIANDTKTNIEKLIIQGKEKVDIGITVAKECSSLLNEIVENVSKVAGLAQEISTASNEQAQGVREINKAMSQLDQVTQGNAAASEEAASSAEELSAQADQLKAAVSDLVIAVQGGHKSHLHQTMEHTTRSIHPASTKTTFKAAS